MNSLTEVNWSGIPAPEDDGAAAHLVGTSLPSIPLQATDGSMIDLSALSGRTVVYIYPMTGRPDVPLPDGWDMLPGARGCTPQSCAFRDHFVELRNLGVEHLFGMSVQGTDYQREAATRLHLPFPLLSDENLELTSALNLPTFKAEGVTLTKRLTLIVDAGTIVQTFYPVFPPDQNASDVMDWLQRSGNT